MHCMHQNQSTLQDGKNQTPPIGQALDFTMWALISHAAVRSGYAVWWCVLILCIPVCYKEESQRIIINKHAAFALLFLLA